MLLPLVLLLTATHAEPNAADAVAPPTRFECRWTELPVTIDGRADEPAWRAAQVIDRFSLPWLKDQARPARTATKARLLWDREYVYFAAEMDDADLFADVTEHDGRTWDNDVFELFFKPADDKPGYYEFQVNAAGTVLDMFLPAREAGGYETFKSDGRFHVEAKVALRGTLNRRDDVDEGWSVEGRIPWHDFLRTGGRPVIGEAWKFALCRYDYSKGFDEPELSTSAPLASLDHADFHHHEDYATLVFVGPPEQTDAKPRGIARAVPVTTSRVAGSPEPPPPFRVGRVWEKLALSWPVFVIHEPGSRRMMFIDQAQSYGPARICRTTEDPASGEYETLLELDGNAYSLAFHPKFAENGYVYVGWNGPVSAKENRKTRVTRYTIGREPPFPLDPDSAQLIIEFESDGHNGGAVVFGLDGMLYVTSGDGTSDSDTNVTGQGLDHLLAKVLRIDVDRPDEGRAYSVPEDNPFVALEGARPETWAYGLRNPWRMCVDPVTGHIWVGNNGQDLWEQAYLVRRGDNYGWSVYEGSHPFYLNRQLGPTPHVRPTVEHPHSEFRSLTGGVVYHGAKFPELKGAYVYGDYSTGKIWGARHDGTRIVWQRELADSTLAISGFGLDAGGELLVVDHRGDGQGGFYALEPTPAGDAASDFPRTLSDSGLFRSVRDHHVQPGLIPYSVNSPLWSDGAHKERFIALPPSGPPGEERPTTIEFTTRGSWSFPDRTVLVKSFALDMVEGDPASRRWIETRFLTKQDGEWVGYSYAWNDDATEAALVETAGADREFEIRTADGGSRRQTWRYPSRTECMVCHSRAANFVLGVSTAQLNRDHDYGGVVDSQLRVLEHLGVLRIDWRPEAVAALRGALERSGLAEKEVDQQVGLLTSHSGQRAPRPSSLLARPPEAYPRLPDPYAPDETLEARARSYLHANCAQCHVMAGGGNAQIDLEFATPLAKTNLIGVQPVHHTFGLADARLVAPGEPDRSVLLHRVAHRGPGQMPQLATSLVDEQAVK
ncbi:MAG TPA: PQQ-dependent sugar dehydrogenase, partial [Planctomycetaceae bacterium]|nr:PQQ-dependent sugar dehydrogenase [Planctomycetaceae bacterium]